MYSGNEPKQMCFSSTQRIESSTTVRPLTPKQAQFVRLFLNNGGNATAAYRGAYDAGRMSDRAVHEEALKLKSHPGIALCLADARTKAVEAISEAAGEAALTKARLEHFHVE